MHIMINPTDTKPMITHMKVEFLAPQLCRSMPQAQLEHMWPGFPRQDIPRGRGHDLQLLIVASENEKLGCAFGTKQV